MSLLVDRLRPTSLEALDFHRDLSASLRNLVIRFILIMQATQSDFPHLIVHGIPGSGKMTRIRCLLRAVYDDSVLKAFAMGSDYLDEAWGKSVSISVGKKDWSIHVRQQPSLWVESERVGNLWPCRNSGGHQRNCTSATIGQISPPF